MEEVFIPTKEDLDNLPEVKLNDDNKYLLGLENHHIFIKELISRNVYQIYQTYLDNFPSYFPDEDANVDNLNYRGWCAFISSMCYRLTVILTEEIHNIGKSRDEIINKVEDFHLWIINSLQYVNLFISDYEQFEHNMKIYVYFAQYFMIDRQDEEDLQESIDEYWHVVDKLPGPTPGRKKLLVSITKRLDEKIRAYFDDRLNNEQNHFHVMRSIDEIFSLPGFLKRSHLASLKCCRKQCLCEHEIRTMLEGGLARQVYDNGIKDVYNQKNFSMFNRSLWSNVFYGSIVLEEALRSYAVISQLNLYACQYVGIKFDPYLFEFPSPTNKLLKPLINNIILNDDKVEEEKVLVWKNGKCIIGYCEQCPIVTTKISYIPWYVRTVYSPVNNKLNPIAKEINEISRNIATDMLMVWYVISGNHDHPIYSFYYSYLINCCMCHEANYQIHNKYKHKLMKWLCMIDDDSFIKDDYLKFTKIVEKDNNVEDFVAKLKEKGLISEKVTKYWKLYVQNIILPPTVDFDENIKLYTLYTILNRTDKPNKFIIPSNAVILVNEYKDVAREQKELSNTDIGNSTQYGAIIKSENIILDHDFFEDPKFDEVMDS